MRIAVVRLDHLGDLILCTPLFRALHRADHTVDLVLPDALLPLFTGHPHLGQVYGIGEAAPGFPGNWRALAAWLRKGRYDVILLPYGREKRLLWASALSGVPPWRRLAMWSGLWGRLSLHICLRSSTFENPRPFAEVLLDLARKLGVPSDGLQPQIVVPPEAAAALKPEWQRRFPGGKVIGIHPGCAGNTCNLPPATYGRLAELLIGLQGEALGIGGVVITGSAAERPLLEHFPPAVLASPKVWNSVGELTLAQLAAAIARLDALVVPSTGPLHIAAALGIPTVSPFCLVPPKSANIWGNQGPTGHVVEPPTSCCRQPDGSPRCETCDFRGTIGETDLLEALVRALP